MKLLSNILYSLLLLICLPYFATAQKVTTGPDASVQFSNAELVRTSKYSHLPSYIQFRKGKQLDIDNLQLWMVSNFKFQPNIGFIQIRKETDNLGHVHYRYQQTLNGTPIEDAIWIAHTYLDKIYSLNGLIYEKINTPTTASLTESSALDKAIIEIGADVYKWELTEEEKHIKWETDDQTATHYPSGELVLVSTNYTFSANDYRLAYKFNIYAHEPMSRSEIYIDANTGEIIRKNEIIHHADEPGTANTGYSGTRDIIADSFDGEYRLRDASRGDGVRTFDMNQGTSYGSSVDFIDDDNDWDNANPELDEYATDAHWGSEMTYDYFLDIHSRNSIDNAGFQLNSYVHYRESYFNAFWDGSRMTYGDGSGHPLTTIDIAGHEITHGLTSLTAGLIYYAESGAINESFSDIFGNSIERFARPDDWDWLLGAELGSPFRSLENPNFRGDPDTYFGTYWASLSGGDSGGVHTNSGVQNFWFYLLTEGGSGTNDNGDDYDVASLGIDNASKIAFRNLTVYLTSSSNYSDARFYSIRAAEDIFGTCTIEMEETANAWYAVGVGGLYDPTTYADFTSFDTLGCSIPHEVNFNNESYNAATFVWEFGDGGTSMEEYPTHVYTEAGVYTVTLSVDGGACGSDTIVYTDFITVDTDLDCILKLPRTGTLGLQTGCIGTLFDSGGDTENYGGGENAYVTIAPLGALNVDLAFLSFNVEAGTDGACNFDFLEIYDGPDIFSPLIDRYCNNNLPSDLTSTGSEITLYFHSDGGLEKPGFEIDWNCNPPEAIPDTDFSVNTEESCNGFVFFTDLSNNIPIYWSWDFGDGDFSDEQNPVHTYLSTGVYTVTLTATNLVGDSTTVKTDYITVTYPENPIVENDTNCTEQTATLTAVADGTLRWYDVATGGTPIFIGESFTTPILDLTTTYYVETDLFDDPLFVGPIDNTFGGGDYFNGDHHLIFNNPSTVILESVDVYANGEGIRTIELRDNTGTVLQTMDIDIPDGASTVTLDMILPVGTDLQLGIALGSSPDLYRNDSGTPAYPYVLAESLEIVGTSSGAENYYFFYNWEIHPYTCVSERIEVVAEVLYDSDITIDAVEDICLEDTPFLMTASASGGNWTADCTDCIDLITGEFDPMAAGIGSWEIVYTVEGTCSYFNTLTVNVVESDITINPVEDICSQGAPVIFTASMDGGIWSADCGSCIDASTGEFDPGVAGDGSWEIVYSVDGTCSHYNTSTINVIDCLGLNSEQLSSISIYPNPSNGQITIHTGMVDGGQIFIKDVLNKTIAEFSFNTPTFSIDLRDINARGTYFVEFYDNNQNLVVVKKIVRY